MTRSSCWILFILGTLVSCGQTAPPQTRVCTPTHSGPYLDVKVTHLSGEHYLFQLCRNSRSDGSPFTVYGATSQSGLVSPTILNRYRLSHVSDAQQAGAQFDVTFSGDLWFVIYNDVNSSGTFVYDSSTTLVSGDLSSAQ